MASDEASRRTPKRPEHFKEQSKASNSSRDTRHALKILILKPSSLGDVVQAIPVLRLLKLHWPDSEIFWWIEAALSPLLEEDPDLAGVVRFDRRGWALPVNWPEVWHSVRWMRRQSFDLVKIGRAHD